MRILAFIFFTSLFFISCDHIEQPIPASTGNLDWNLYPFDTTTTPYPWPSFSSNTNTLRNVLLEDYTGHTCTNCPGAADIAHQLELDYPNRLILASIHASPSGSFQAVQPPEFTIDFTTDAGNTYVSEMDGFLGNPLGTINRQETSIFNSVWFLDSDWSSTVGNEINSAPLISNLQLKYNYYYQTNGIFIHTETEFKDNLTGDYNLIIYLLRDTVIGPQKLNNGTTEYNYKHHAVLSNNINGTWGTSVSTGSANSGDIFYNNFSYQLPDPLVDSTYAIDNLSLVTYLCNRNSYEVVQVIKTKLAP